MAQVRVNQCRTHPGGTFKSPIQRGRPPVKCSEDNPCTKSTATAMVAAAVSRSEKSGYCSCNKLGRHERGIKGCKYATVFVQAGRLVSTTEEAPAEAPRKRMRGTKATTVVNHSIPMAHAAKTRLEPHGWSITGRAWFASDAGYAEVVATRGEEMITLLWEEGEMIGQVYSIWNVDKPTKNNKPASELPFDTDEMPDAELAKELAGRTVTWWNRLGTNTETGTVPDRISVQHVLSATGDEVPDDRVITFVDLLGGGFRSFRLGALIKVK